MFLPLVLHIAAALSGRPLSALVQGESLRGTVLSRHEELLYLKVDVHDDVGLREQQDVPAILSLPRSHPMLQTLRIGADLTVYVKKVTSTGRLRVGLFPPRDPPRVPASDDFKKLEDLHLGDKLQGEVIKIAACGAFVDVGVWRQGRKGRWRAVDALIPVDQQPSVSEEDAVQLAVGDVVVGRVLEPNLASGRLLMTLRGELIDVLRDELNERRVLAKARQRRKSTSKLKPGSEREGFVVRVDTYGLLVNVGAKQTGLVHISNIGQGLIDNIEAVAKVGDIVLVEVLAPAKLGDKGYRGEGKLRLSLKRKLVQKSEDVPASVLATARRGETLRQRYERLEDALVERREQRRASSGTPPRGDIGGVAAPGAAAVPLNQARRIADESNSRAVAVEGIDMVEERLAELNEKLEHGDDDEYDDVEWDDDYFADKYEDDFY
eukprot:scaffold136175_cov32-Tisochrysis_lutea.AAC.1